MKKVLFGLLVLGAMASCKKDSSSSPTATQPNVTPTPTDAYGVLAAVKTNNYVNIAGFSMNMPIGTAVAVFSDAAGLGTYVDAGAVTADDSTLTKQSNNSYVFMQTGYNTTGLDFSSGNAKWTVAGNGTVPAINKTTTSGFPFVDSVSAAGEVSIASELNLHAASAVINADSIIYVVAGPDATLMKTVAGGVNSYTFSAADMATVGTGTGYLEVVPYNIEKQTISGKAYYYINESASTKMVKFTN